jgi:hypothetical protein
MNINASKLLAIGGGNALLIGQLVFSTTFVGACELANVLSGKYSLSACESRWYVVTALFFPSAAQMKPISIADNRRRRHLFGNSES